MNSSDRKDPDHIRDFDHSPTTASLSLAPVTATPTAAIPSTAAAASSSSSSTSSDAVTVADISKPHRPFGSQCYRKNPQQPLEQYHPSTSASSTAGVAEVKDEPEPEEGESALPDPDTFSPKAISPEPSLSMHDAAKEGDLGTIKAMYEGGSHIDLLNGDFCTPLHLAAQSGHLDVVIYLLGKGADPLANNNSYKKELLKWTPLHTAVCENRKEYVKNIDEHDKKISKILEALIVEAQAKNPSHKKSDIVNMKDVIGRTPLHIAVMRGYTAAVETLLKHGADASADYYDEAKHFTPMTLAEKEEIKELLCQYQPNYKPGLS